MWQMMVYFRNFRVDIHASLSIDLWMNLRLCTWLLVMRTYNKPSWHGSLCKCSVVERSQYDWFVCRFAFLSRKLFLRRAVAQLAATRHSSLGHVLLSSRRQYNQDQNGLSSFFEKEAIPGRHHYFRRYTFILFAEFASSILILYIIRSHGFSWYHG